MLITKNISVFALKNLFINFYLLKLQIVYHPIENILLKHITGVVLCFSKNTSVDQHFLHKNLLSYKKLLYFAEQANISYELAISSFILFLFIYLFESDTRSIEKRKNTHNNNNNKKRKQAGKKNRTFELHQQLKTMFIIVTLVEEIAIHSIVNIHITRMAAPFYKSINKFSL